MSLPLQQLKIDSPCPVKWNTMRGDHRSRFCEQCQKHVHNVSAMTRPEIDRLLAGSPARVCLRGYVRPDGELVTQEGLADAVELYGGSRLRVEAIRAAVASGLAAVAISLAACTEDPRKQPAVNQAKRPAAHPDQAVLIPRPVRRAPRPQPMPIQGPPRMVEPQQPKKVIEQEPPDIGGGARPRPPERVWY